MSLLEKLKALLVGGSSRDSGSGNPTSGAPGATTTPNTSSEQAVKEPTEPSSPAGTTSPSIEDSEPVETADETPDTAETADVESDEAENVEAEADDAESGDTEDVETETRDSTGESTPVSDISGIGPAYSERLESIGVETVEQLATADPDDIASQTDISIGRVSNWIERARDA